MRGACRRIGIFAIALMVITSMVAPTAMAATSTGATTPDEDCEKSYGEMFYEALTLQPDVMDTTDYECQAKQLEKNEWADIYASGLAVSDLRKGSLTPIRNHLEDSKTYGRTIAKTEAVKLFNNESNNLTKSEIKAEVNDSIEAYYATMQHNMISAHNASANQILYQENARDQAGIMNVSLMAVITVDHPDPTYSSNSYLDDSFSEITENATLVDGTTRDYRTWANSGPKSVFIDKNHTDDAWFYIRAADPTFDWDPNNDQPEGDATLENDTNSERLYSSYEYVTLWKDIEKNATDMKTEAAAFVDLLYNNYNRSEGVDVTEVLSANDLVSQWNTDYNTTGYYGWIAATMGLTGLEGNVNSSFAINYTPRVDHYRNGNYSINGSGAREYAYVNGTSYNVSGTLMTDWDPNPNESYAFERNATYDTANADVPVLFIEQVDANESRVIRLNGTFEIDTLTNVQTGETINSTSLEEQNQQTWNESSSVDEINKLIEYRNKSVEINEAGGGTGGGGGFNFDFGAAGFGFIAIAGGALLLLSNRS